MTTLWSVIGYCSSFQLNGYCSSFQLKCRWQQSPSHRQSVHTYEMICDIFRTVEQSATLIYCSQRSFAFYMENVCGDVRVVWRWLGVHIYNVHVFQHRLHVWVRETSENSPCLTNEVRRSLTFRHRASSIQDRHFATLQRTLFIYLINKYISLSDICLTVHH